ncbi:hypothetical protein HBI42_143170 [Parastagonospora nodorum]|nr:hypothetical protein HBH50_241770 [Parastagonospora nodorum]KAH4077676.1 hypothetical protein HBH48_240720 [Parastagonospora nodorum]KAH5719177.1 hypothetical protein HBI20_112670 [Parastagonospora nodorum]KAH6213102.1 hypothetical protein HBI43_146200 [Parastagonospora nodorum]KAH6247474.1 hypothetical protein HBI41_227660 [Parastagonospora nodorum]
MYNYYKAILSYSKALAIKHRLVKPLLKLKSLLFLALAYLKDLGVLVILSSKELLALVILQLLEAPSNSAQSSLTLMPISLSYSYVTALLRA